jgi:NAD(P)-dependent dehydrogenase (short-subunit alcohol dehydrogenase family)
MGEVALVTGAAAGIGRATAERLAADGFDLALVDVDRPRLEALAAELEEVGHRLVSVVRDLIGGQPFDDVVVEVGARLGPIDVLVNNAGTAVRADVPSTSREDWDRVMGLNVTAVYEMCRAVLPGMLERGRGRIVNVASVAGLVGIQNRAAYCASKAAVIGLTRAMAADHSAAGIRINAVCPGTVHTEWIDRILADHPDPVQGRADMEARQLEGRLGEPSEIAAAIAYLVSEDASFVNGSAFVVDGGMTAV